MDSCTVKHVMFYTGLKPGNLMLCECEDGSVQIFRDDHPLPASRWNMADIAKAIVAYQEMKLKLQEHRLQ